MSKGIGIKNNYKLGGSVNKATNVQKANVGLLIKTLGKLPVVKEGVKKVLKNYRMSNPSKFMDRRLKLTAGPADPNKLINSSKFMDRRLKLTAGNNSTKNTVKQVLTSKPAKVAVAGAAAAGAVNEASKDIKKLSKDESFKKGREEGAKKGKEFSEKVKTKMGEAVGYITGKKFGGSTKVTKANLGLLMANKKIAGAGLLGLGMLAKKKFSKGGKSGKRKA